MDYTETSKFLSLILRHKPEVIGISLDEHGWANVDELIEGMAKEYPIDKDILEDSFFKECFELIIILISSNENYFSDDIVI